MSVAYSQSDPLDDYGGFVDSKQQPRYAWVDKCIEDLKKSGLLVGYPGGFIDGRRPSTRFEDAVATHATYVHIKNCLHDAESNDAANPNNVQFVNAAEQAIPTIRRLTIEFSFELTALGVPVPDMLADIQLLEGNIVKPLQPRPEKNDEIAKLYKDLYRFNDFAALDDSSQQEGGHTPTNFDVALGAYNLFQVLDRRIANAAFVDDDTRFQAAIESVELAGKGPRVKAFLQSHHAELQQLGIDCDAAEKSVTGWQNQIETLWSPANMTRWKLDAPSPGKTG